MEMTMMAEGKGEMVVVAMVVIVVVQHLQR
jgi:hypothetical protein